MTPYVLAALLAVAVVMAVAGAVGWSLADRALRAHRRARVETDPT